MILAIDTSTRLAGVAVFDGVQVLAETIWNSRNFHTVELAPAANRAVHSAGINLDDIRAVGIALGPGSFTGLRIGLAFAKGIVLGNHIPLIGIPTLDFLAAGQDGADLPLAAVLRVGRGRLAVGHYNYVDDKWQKGEDTQVLDIVDLSKSIRRPTVVCGELTAEERRFLGRKRKNVKLVSPAKSIRRPSFLAELAWQRFQLGLVDDSISLAPIYLHSGERIPG